jgi:hypothetical protein
MPEHKCERCGKTFGRRNILVNHFNRKIPCEDINDISIESIQANFQQSITEKKKFTCSLCGNKFSSAKSKAFHEKNSCKERHIPDKIQPVHQLLQIAPVNQVVYVNNNYLVQNTIKCCDNKVQLTLNNFNNESIEYVMNEKSFLTRCLKNLINGGVRDVVKKIYFDDSVPQNNNVRIKSVKRNLCEIFDNDQWTIVDKNETLQNMILKGCNVLQKFYFSDQDIIDEDDMNESGYLMKLIDIRSKHLDVFNPIRNQVYALLLNQRAILLDSDE